MDKPIVSVVILTWNSAQVIGQCVDHVLAQEYENVEVIIVDNGSSDGALNMLKERYPEFRYIDNNCNTGFAKGMNQGIEVANGSYLLLLNADAFIQQDFIASAIEAIETDQSIGSIAGRVHSWVDGRKTNLPQGGHNGGVMLRKRMQGTNNKNDKEPSYVFGPSGPCSFIRRIALDDVKQASTEYFDETYFAHGEDIDLWYRMQLRGWKCLFTPRVLAWHVGSAASEGNISLIKKPLWLQRHRLKNRYLTIIKDTPLALLWRLSPYLFVTEAAMWPFFLCRAPRTLVALLGAWLDVIRLLPLNIRKRRLIQNSRCVQSSYLQSFFVEF